ncbi:MAG: flippase-like domain-containing protein [candidate division Zixibacteria bacterium]|nr:flippase-like domain-containing protein [candidate division Zixibacteria bacterium]
MMNTDIAQQETVQDVSIKSKLLRPGNLIALLVAVFVIYIFLRRFHFAEAITIIGKADIWLFIAAVFVFYVSLPLRGHRWKILLAGSNIDLPQWDLTRYYFLAWFANCILPARIGDVYRAYLLKKNNQISVSLSLGVLFSEKIFDLASTAILVMAGGLFYFDKIADPHLRAIIIDGLWIVGILVVIFTILSWRSGILKKILPVRFLHIYELFSRGLFRTPRLIPLVGVESFMIWLTEAGRLFFVAWALGLRIDFMLAVFISQASLILMTLPLTPAGLGLVELLMLTLLGQTGLSGDMAAAVVIGDRLISFWSLIIFGGIHYLLSSRSR